MVKASFSTKVETFTTAISYTTKLKELELIFGQMAINTEDIVLRYWKDNLKNGIGEETCLENDTEFKG